MSASKRILIDFDRVVHKYSKGWQDGRIYDKPVEGAIEALRELQAAGYEVVIFTAESELGEARMIAIRIWLVEQGLTGIKVTSTKLPALAIIDDRAIRFTDWNDMLRYFVCRETAQ